MQHASGKMVYIVDKGNHIYITDDEHIQENRENVIIAMNNSVLASRVIQEMLREDHKN